MMKTLRAFLDLMRIVPNQIMLGIGVLIGEVVASSGLPALRECLLGFLGPFILGASTFAMNDYYDLEADKRGGRTDRPLVRGDISPNTARWIFLIGFPVGLVLSSMINLGCLLIAVIFAGLALAYNISLKETGLPGNLFIASTMGIPFLYGSVAVEGGFPVPIIVLALIAFLAGAGREVLKDIMDFKGDAARNSRTLARTKGIHHAARVSSLFLLIAILLSPIPFLHESGDSFYLNMKYIVPILFTDIILAYVVIRTLRLSQPEEAVPLRTLSLIALSLGLLGFLLGSF